MPENRGRKKDVKNGVRSVFELYCRNLWVLMLFFFNVFLSWVTKSRRWRIAKKGGREIRTKRGRESVVKKREGLRLTMVKFGVGFSLTMVRGRI